MTKLLAINFYSDNSAKFRFITHNVLFIIIISFINYVYKWNLKFYNQSHCGCSLRGTSLLVSINAIHRPVLFQFRSP